MSPNHLLKALWTNRLVRLTVLTALILLCFDPAPVLAEAKTDALDFRGQFIDGPFAGKRIKGSCKIDLQGDYFSQRAPCTLWVFDGEFSRGEPFKVVDPEASIEIIDGYVLRIILGLSVPPSDGKGNFKHSFFEAVIMFDKHQPARPIHDGQTVVIGGLFQDVNVTLSGFSSCVVRQFG
jgi:hypothetical protein